MMLFSLKFMHITTLTSFIFLFLSPFLEVACPRLSMDWGESYGKPLLSSYEARGSCSETKQRDKS